jgi:hypothetical protein
MWRSYRALGLIVMVAACGTDVGKGQADAAAPVDGARMGSGSGGFCAPCVESSDCAGAGMCLGETGNCGIDCSHDGICPTGSTCERVAIGMSPPLGMQCMPTAAACDLTIAPAVDCSDGWSGYANPFFAHTCRGCHVSGYDTAAAVGGGASSVRLAIETGAMPAGTTLAAADRRRILTWLACEVHGLAPPLQ